MGALLDLALEADPAQQPSTLSGRPHRIAKDQEQRARQAIQMLHEAPARRAAFIAGPEVDGLIPVTLVVRTQDGMVCGEMGIPTDRWDPWLFLRFLEAQDGKATA